MSARQVPKIFLLLANRVKYEMNNGTTLAKLQKVKFQYNRYKEYILEDVDFEIRPGEVILLAGPNGSGKSTLLGLLSGRLKPSFGTVQVFEKDPTTVSRVSGIGLITEPFHPEQSPLPVDLTVREVFEWLKILDNVNSKTLKQVSDELGLSASLHSMPIQMLSKGERQRVMLLVALLRRPQLILADEPLDGLDRKSRQLMGENLRSYAKTTNACVLWVSHYLAETLEYADRLFKIRDRKLIEELPNRFKIRTYSPCGETINITSMSLECIPDLIARNIEDAGEARVEIEDTFYKEKRK